MGRRGNTFRIDFSNVPKKPDTAKVHKFCATVLGLKQGEVLRIQNSRALGVTFVKVIDLALAQRVCEEHDNQHEISVDGKKYPLRITLEDGAVEVKLFDLSEDVTDQTISEFLAKYGEVIEIREQRSGADVDFPGILTGVRIVKMIVKHNIESWITIDGETTAVAYFGQRNTCKHCRDFVHVGITCVQNKKIFVQKSYADAARQMGSTPSAPRVSIVPAANPNCKTASQTAPKANKSSTNSAGAEDMPPPKQAPHQKPQQVLPKLLSVEQNALASSGSLTDSTGQQTAANIGIVRKSANGISDGNDTDTSVGSSSSSLQHPARQLRNRPPGKKPRVEDSNNKREGSNQSF